MVRVIAYVLVAVLVLLAGLGVWLYRGDLPAEEVDARYAYADSRFLDLGADGLAHVRVLGPGDAPVLMLIHGSNASLHTWEAWGEILSDRYRVVMLDLPGHGLTGATPKDAYDIRTMVAFVDRVADALALERFALAGNSMGGNVAWRYANAHPSRLSALILVNASGIPRTEEEAAQSGSVFRLMRNPLARALLRWADPESTIEQGLEASFHDKSLVTEAMVERYVALNLRAGTRAATMKRFASYDGEPKDPAPRLRALQMPTLIIHGRQDALIPMRHAEVFNAVIPNSELILYDETGHIPMEERAEQSAADVAAFLKERI